MSDTKPTLAEIWQKYDAMERRLSAPLSSRILDLAQLRPGLQVLDLASGRGEPAIEAARRVAPDGQVVGIDIDASVIEIAKSNSKDSGIMNLSLRQGTIESIDGIREGSFDAVTVRWGLMYFSDPIGTLRTIRRYLKGKGSLVLAVWVKPEESSFFDTPRAALAKHTAVEPPDYDAPGTFFYRDSKRLTRHLETSGFRITHSEDIEVDVMEAHTDSELVEWCETFGVTGLLDDLSYEVKQSWKRELISLAERFRRNDGAIRLGGISRVVVAV